MPIGPLMSVTRPCIRIRILVASWVVEESIVYVGGILCAHYLGVDYLSVPPQAIQKIDLRPFLGTRVLAAGTCAVVTDILEGTRKLQ
jgi:hypothetical protein